MCLWCYFDYIKEGVYNKRIPLNKQTNKGTQYSVNRNFPDKTKQKSSLLPRLGRSLEALLVLLLKDEPMLGLVVLIELRLLCLGLGARALTVG